MALIWKTRVFSKVFIKKATMPCRWVVRYSGLEFIYRKFNPSRDPEPLPTGFIWLVSIYIVLFGIAFNMYTNRTTEITNMVNNLMAELKSEGQRMALSKIPNIQWQPCPVKPILFNPKSVLVSLWGSNTQYEIAVEALKNVIVEHRNMLGSLSLDYCDLRGAVVMGGDFEKSSLLYSSLDQGSFAGINFKNANFFYATFKYAWFDGCSFEGANLLRANFEGTFFSKCDFEGAKGLELSQLLQCRSLYQCKIDPIWLEFIKKYHPEKLAWSGSVSMDKLDHFDKRTFPPYLEKILREHIGQSPTGR